MGHAIRYALPLLAAVAWLGTSGAQAKPLSVEPRCTVLAMDREAGVVEAQARRAGSAPMPAIGEPPLPSGWILPAHCEIRGVLDARTGADGQRYAIRYHLRLPEVWNGRFLFQGGGGTNGVEGNALGAVGYGATPALALGYAVVSEDSGHDNRINSDPNRGGVVAFGSDPQARADYGGTSLPRVAEVAKRLIARFYGHGPKHSYFYGCSKGGQEGMVFAQRYPEMFDGIVAAAPGFALPRAALAQAWDVQTFSAIAPVASFRRFAALPGAFSDAQLGLVRAAVLAACDADDGVRDGIVARFDRCTDAKVLPALAGLTCGPGSAVTCLTAVQVAALRRSLGGPQDSSGKTLYSRWLWDAGIGSDGWRLWKLGSDRMPALNLLTGGPALAMLFTVPPTPLHDSPEDFLNYELGFDFDRDAGRIYATGPGFPRSAWEDMSARSADLEAFRHHGGKLLVPHGASDPVFSIADTFAWYVELQRQNAGQAASFARVFAVPGMNHCSGGPATDRFDAFEALVAWVEQGRAPDRIVAKAGSSSPWPGRTRPLCAWPKAAVYRGRGNVEDARNFVCKL